MDNYQNQENNQENVSGTGSYQNSQEVPNEIKGWNWGAFMFTFLWGVGNKVYISLVCLIPIANIVFPFILGAKGNEWAWKAGFYRDVEEFKKTQSSWKIAGLIAFVLAAISVILSFLFLGAMITALASYYNGGYYY
jgi:hypothetical protein